MTLKGNQYFCIRTLSPACHNEQQKRTLHPGHLNNMLCDPNILSTEGSWLLDSVFLEEMKYIFRKGHMVVLRQWRKQREISNKGHSRT